MAKLGERFAQIAKGEHKRTFDVFPKESVTYLEIPVDQIEPDVNQPRKELGDLEGLKASIKEHGIIEPLIVSPNGFDTYKLIAGERRFSAAKEVGLQTVPAIVRTVEEHKRLELQIVENLHRKDLNAIEEAGSYKRLMIEFNLTQEEVGKRIGKSVASINETLRLLDLPNNVKDEFRTSEKVSKSVLLHIVRQPKARQQAMWEEAKRGELTVKKAREQSPTKSAQKPGRAKPTKKEIKTQMAIITLRFRKARVTNDEVKQALKEALKSLD
jgi:ParB family chromosome partitioning protein